MCPWYPPDPHEGGSKIPSDQYDDIIKQVNAYSAKQSWSSYYKIQVRFRGQFCYIDTISENDNRIFAVCRLRQKIEGRWSLANFTYSNDQYMPYIFSNGKHEGTIKDALYSCELLMM